MKKPWMKFYPADWRSDPRLRMCSLSARGLWADLICYMHEGEPYGHLTIDGVQPTLEEISALVGRPLGEVRKALKEIEDKKVARRAENGALFSSRMVRDKAKADQDEANGRGGGNPKLKKNDNGGDNPPHNGGDKAQKLEARTQKAEQDSEPSLLPSPTEIINLSCEAKSEKRSPPRHGLTSKGRIYLEKGTPEWASYAADFIAVRGFEPNANPDNGRWFKYLGEASEDDNYARKRA